MKNKLNLALTLLTIIFLASCSTSKKIVQQKNEVKKESKEIHWSHHKGDDGPENWKNLCVGFSDCNGKKQSPIDIVTLSVLKENKLVAPKFSYGESSVNVINNGHTVQFNVDGDNKVNLNGKDYKLLQFHYHAKSEHTINGKHFPLEVHFVHQHSATEYAVLGMMFEEGKKNKLLAKYLGEFPASKGTFKSEDTIDVLSLFPSNKSYYNYKGSLTTPPCSEVVNWYILKTPLTASKEQIAQFSEILHNNYRPIQAINGRLIRGYN